VAKKKAETTERRKAMAGAGLPRQSGGEILQQPLGETPAVLPAGYAELLEDLKDRIRRAQVRAAVAASRELNLLYFDIGRRIVEQQAQEGWGAKVIDRLAADLRAAFPGRSGFSRTNVHRMRAFYLAYTQGVTYVPQAVGQIPAPIVPQAVGQISGEKSAQVVPKLDGVNLPQPAAEVPWGHNVALVEKVATPHQRV